jgi:hypothetical protein
VADVAGQSIFDVLASDHRDLEELIARATAEPGNDGLRELLVMELVRHFVAEEQYLYPLVRERGAAGDRLADEAFTMHRQCEDTLRGLEHDETDEVRVAATLAEVAGQLRTHVRAQEPDLFQQLAAGRSPPDLAELGSDVLGAEQLAPTRPRTLAAESASVNKVSSLVTGFIDRVRDTYSHRGT